MSTGMQGAAVNFATSGDHAVITAGANKIIVVRRMMLTVAAAVNLTFRSGGTALTGPMSFSAYGTMTFEEGDVWWFACTPGENLIINSSAAVQVSGRIGYFYNTDHP